MPPEQPEYLVILDLTCDSGKPGTLAGTTEHVRPLSPGRLRVRWGVGEPPGGYERRGRGVVFVHGAEPAGTIPLDPAPNLKTHGKGNHEFSEGLGGAPWLMLVMVLPEGTALASVTPGPTGRRRHGDRLAYYWRLGPGKELGGSESVLFALKEWHGDEPLSEPLAWQPPLPFDTDNLATKVDLFISYRRKDDRWAVAPLRAALGNRFGERSVFRDVNSIRPGQNVRTVIDEAVGQCRVLLAVIGPNWLDPGQARGQRRIDAAQDWPRLEIESALQRHKTVIPLLLDDTPALQAKLLPESLEELAALQCIKLREESFDADVHALSAELHRILEPGWNAR